MPRTPEGSRAVRFAVATTAAFVAAAAALLAADAGAAPGDRAVRAAARARHRGGVAGAPYETYEGIAGYFDPAGTWSDPTAPPPFGDVKNVAESAPVRVAVGPYPTVVHLDVPAGSAAQFQIRRVAGAAPQVLWVQDAEGRAWTPAMQTGRRTSVSEAIPVTAAGGLDLVLVPTRSRRCVVDVAMRAEPLDPGGDPADAPDPETPWAPGRIVVSGDLGLDVETLAQQMGVEILEQGDGYSVLGTPEGRTGLEWLDADWMSQANALRGGFEPDAYAEPPETSQSNQAVVGSEFGRSYPRQPALRTVGVPPAGLRLRGTGVTIAVLDTGIDATHPLFAGRLVPGRDFVGGDDDPSEERDHVDQDRDGRADEGYGHGTIVAGLALAVAPGAKILPVRVLDGEGLGTASRVSSGMRWAVGQGARVINLSLGTRSWSRVLEDAVRDAAAAGALVIVAAGNDGDRYSVDFPADVPGAVAVTALGLRGRRAPFGNGNRTSAVAAPGVHVIGPYPGGTWAMCTGTSFAAPLASGAAALLLEEAPASDGPAFRARLAPRGRLDLRPIWR